VTTIFTIPKPFIGHNEIIQKNAINSWIQLIPKCEIILCGDDCGVEEASHKYGVKHIRVIEKNEWGTPLLSSCFSIVQQFAHYDTLMYVNTDIILFPTLLDAIKNIDAPQYIICGRRWDLDVREEIDFSESNWADKLLDKARMEGRAHSLSGIDYFIFRRNTIKMPPFAVGRPGWDGWLIGEMRRRGIPVIDASESILVIHQNHDYSHSPFGRKKRIEGPEWAENIRLAGGLKNMMTLRDADWILTREGLKRPSFPRCIFPFLSLIYPWRVILATKRRLQNAIGN